MAGIAMTRDDIIRMAREAGMERVIDTHKDGTRTIELPHPDLLERFAALVAAAERERVMQIVQSMKADLEAKFENVYMEGAMAGAAAEREACAKVCDELIADTPDNDPDSDAIGACAIAIRARSNP